jgi:multiple sugar transport system substrate-binding protein
VTVWDYEYESIPDYTKAIDKVDADFEHLHPGVTVDRQAVPPESFEAQYRAAFSSHQGPDVMIFQPGTAGVLSFAAGLEPLNDSISPDLAENLTGWEAVTPGFKQEGERLGVPIGLQGWVFYYNKKLFAKAGLPTNFKPKSWAEVREAGEQLKAAGIQPFAGGNKEGYDNSYWFSVGFQTENTRAQVAEFGEGKIPFTSPLVSKAFGPQVEMEEAELLPKEYFSTPQFSEGYPSFAEGQGAMVLGFWNSAGYWGEFNPALGEKNVGIFFPPGVSPVAAGGSTVFSIPKFAANKEAAWALLEYTASKAGIETLDEVGGLLPNRKDVSLPASDPVQAHELIAAYEHQDPIIAPYAMIPAQVLFGPMGSEVSQALQGRTSLQSAQEAMQEAAEKAAEE